MDREEGPTAPLISPKLSESHIHTHTHQGLLQAGLKGCQLILAQPWSLAFFLSKVTEFSRSFPVCVCVFFFPEVINQISPIPLVLWPREEKPKGERKQEGL